MAKQDADGVVMDQVESAHSDGASGDRVKAALPQRIPSLSGLARWPLPSVEVYEMFCQALRKLEVAPDEVGEHVGLVEVPAGFARQSSVTIAGRAEVVADQPIFDARQICGHIPTDRTLFVGDIDGEEIETFQQAHYRQLRMFKLSSLYTDEVARLESIGPPPPMASDGAIGRILYYEYHRPTRDELEATVAMMQAENLISEQEAEIERAALDAAPSGVVVARLKFLADPDRPR